MANGVAIGGTTPIKSLSDFQRGIFDVERSWIYFAIFRVSVHL
jgi:hypothetical protein